MKECFMCGKKIVRGYLCEPCKTNAAEDLRRIDELARMGHTDHCATRQVWGDGECECHVEGKGDGAPDNFPRFHKIMGYGE